MKNAMRFVSPFVFVASIFLAALIIVRVSLVILEPSYHPFTALILLLLLLLCCVSFLFTALALRRERAERAEIIEKMSDGMLVTDQLGTVLHANSRAREMLGYTKNPIGVIMTPRERGKGEWGNLPNLFFPNDTPQGIFRDTKPTREYLFSEPIEQYLKIDTTILSHKRGDPAGTRVIFLIHDVSREKILSKLKSEFISIAAHQLRTPLSAIKWTLRLFLDEDLGPISAEQREYMQLTYGSNERMIKLVNDLLNVSRIEEGRFEYVFEELDLAALVESSLAPFKEIAAQKNIHLLFRKPLRPLPPIVCDKDKIGMVLQNLIENAIRYTSAEGSVTVSLEEETQFVAVAVTDTGIGMAKEDKARLFTKFFRAERAIRTAPDGTGLGLFIAKNIIVRHEGTITVESEVGKGSAFRFRLPKWKNAAIRNRAHAEGGMLRELMKAI